MTSVSVPTPRFKALGRWFYLGMAVVMAVVIVAGFAQTYPASIRSQPPLPAILHLHAAVFASWVLLIVVQPALARLGSMRLHRTLGYAGAALAGAMVIMGYVAVSAALREHYVPSFLPRRIFVVGNLLTVSSFGGLVAAAVANRGRPEWHKRLMIGATIMVLPQALGRLLPMSSFGDAAPAVLFGVVMLFGLAGPVVDLIARGRVHPAYYWSVGTLAVAEILTPAIAFSPLALPIIHAFGG